MRTKAAIEVDAALRILSTFEQVFEEMDRWWPPNRRGSNAQRVVKTLKEKIAAAELCCRDAMAVLEPSEEKSNA